MRSDLANPLSVPRGLIPVEIDDPLDGSAPWVDEGDVSSVPVTDDQRVAVTNKVLRSGRWTRKPEQSRTAVDLWDLEESILLRRVVGRCRGDELLQRRYQSHVRALRHPLGAGLKPAFREENAAVCPHVGDDRLEC